MKIRGITTDLEQDLEQSIQWLLRHFSQSLKCEPHDAIGIVRGQPKSLGFIVQGL